MTDEGRPESQHRPDWAALVIARSAGHRRDRHRLEHGDDARRRQLRAHRTDLVSLRDRRGAVRAGGLDSGRRAARRIPQSARNRTSHRWCGSSAGLAAQMLLLKVAGFSIATGLLVCRHCARLRARPAVADDPGRHRAGLHHLDHLRQGAAAVAAGRTAGAVDLEHDPEKLQTFGKDHAAKQGARAR